MTGQPSPHVSSTAKALLQDCERELPASLAFLKTLVAVNSHTSNAVGINRSAELTAAGFHSLGFTASFPECHFPDTGNHLVLRRGDPGLPTVVMVSHLDTVFTEEEERRNAFAWRECEGRIHGPGTIDIKGGTALMHLMLSVLARRDPERFEGTQWILLLNACEERDHDDFARLCQEVLPPRPRACLVFEGDHGTPGDFILAPARKGKATFSIRVEGHGAHAGAFHQRGANALVELSRIVNRLEGLTDYGRGLTVNVGYLRGGTELNRVPHEAEAGLEMRCFDPELFEQIQSRILACEGPGEVASRDGTGRHCQVRVKRLGRTDPWPHNPGSEGLVQLWQEAGLELGVSVAARDRGGLSDGNMLWRKMPTLDGLGPCGGNSHCSESSPDGSKTQEWVNPRSMAPKAALNLLGLSKLLSA